MEKFKIIIEYNGKNYCGWQKQTGQSSVQGELEKAAFNIFSKNVDIVGAGRTDAGVHAVAQVAHFCVETDIPVGKIALAFNAHLPLDIAVKKAETVSVDFHARYSAKGKKYVYSIYNAGTRPAIFKDFTTFIPTKLNIKLMQEAAAAFLGTHDFAAFMAAGSSVKSTIRTINYISVVSNGDYIFIAVKGNGFLYNQVRIMAGTLIEAGKGKILPEDVSDIIKSKKRELAGPTAPPEGLILHEVMY